MSKLDIWNVALTKLGIPTVKSTTDSVGQATAMAANWDLFKETFLRDHVWNGAKTTQELTRFQNTITPGDATPVARWSFAYLLPTSPEWVRSVRLNGKENRSGAKSIDGLGLWEEEVVFNDAGVGKLCLVTGESVATLEFIFLTADNDIAEFLTADMQWAMALTFAVHMAADLGSSVSDINQLEQQAEISRRNARRTDAQSGAKVTLQDTTIHDSFF